MDEKTLALVIEDTQLNYVKKSYLFRDINIELRGAFVNAGISFEPVKIADYLQKSLVIESKKYKKRIRTRLFTRLGSLSSAAKLPSLVFPFITFLSAAIVMVTHYLFKFINSLPSLIQDPVNDSYTDILKRHTKERLIIDEELKNKAKSEALDKVRILVEESIDDTKVMVQVSCGN